MCEGSDKYEKIMELAKRRGFFWPSFEIYGGVSGFYDLGPYGTLLKRNIIDLWIKHFVIRHMDIATIIETPVINPEIVFRASGHLESFTDPIVTCIKCGRVFRADKLIEGVLKTRVEGLPPSELSRIIKENKIRCPFCGGELGNVRTFNLLFKTTIGPYAGNTGYLRPETAQGMFIAFKRVHTVMRGKLPLGIAQVGRVARNEISPRQGMIRLREFTIMEMEFFFDPEDPREVPLGRIGGKLNIVTANSRMKGVEEPEPYEIREAVEEGVVTSPWMAYWMGVSRDFIKELGVPEHDIIFEEKLPNERAHYASQTFDQLVKVSRWGWVEVSGHAYRGDYDLSRHEKYSKQDLGVFKRFEKPLEKRILKVRVNKAILGRIFRSETPKVIEAINKDDPRRLKHELVKGVKSIKIGPYEVPAEAIEIVEDVIRVHGKKIIPHVVEPSFGVERLVYVALDRAYREVDGRIVLALPPKIAPVKVCVFPLVTNDNRIISIAKKIYRKLVNAGVVAIYDESGNIGRRYARADEIGVPYAVTVDHRTLEDGTVTIRFRDTRHQIRVNVDDVTEWIKSHVQ